MSPRVKTILFGTVTTAVSIVLCFLFLEYVATYFIYADTQESVDKQFDPVLGWRYVPGEYRMKPDSSFLTHTIRINQLGLRGPDQAPVAGTNRIIVLGDSFTFARQVSEPEMFTSQFEAILNASSPAGHHVMNAGVEGFGTAQQLLLLRELEAAGIVGDLYVLQIFTNDVLDNLRLDYSSLSIDALRPGFRIRNDGSLYLEHTPDKRQWLGGDEPKGMPLRTLRVIKGAVESFAQSRPALVRFATSFGVSVDLPRKPGLIGAWYNDETLTRSIPLMERLIQEINNEVNRLQGTLIVLSIPSPLMVYPETYRPILSSAFPDDAQVGAFLADPEKPARIIRRLCEELSVPLVDMYPILRSNGSAALFFPRDGHLQPAGHAIVADSLAERALPYLARE